MSDRVPTEPNSGLGSIAQMRQRRTGIAQDVEEDERAKAAAQAGAAARTDLRADLEGIRLVAERSRKAHGVSHGKNRNRRVGDADDPVVEAALEVAYAVILQHQRWERVHEVSQIEGQTEVRNGIPYATGQWARHATVQLARATGAVERAGKEFARRVGLGDE